ncbi:coiled-coil domain-containing protein 172-like [Glandiceps talaboti]
MSLDELFVQILQSEQKAQARRNYLIKNKTETNVVHELVIDTNKEVKALREQLLLKYQTLGDEELKLKWLKSKEGILQEQVQELVASQTLYTSNLEETQTTALKRRENFVFKIQKFNKRYDLCESGQKLRQDEAKTKLTKLMQEEEILEKELTTFKSHREQVQCLEEDKCLLKLELEDILQKIHELETEIEKEHAVIIELEKRKMSVAKKPQTDPEFQRLQMELESCKAYSMEEMCEVYRLELQQLQQKQWQKQLQQRQNMKTRKVSQSQNQKHRNSRIQMVQGRLATVNPYQSQDNLNDTDVQTSSDVVAITRREQSEPAASQQTQPNQVHRQESESTSTRSMRKSSRMLPSIHLPPRAKKVHFKNS